MSSQKERKKRNNSIDKLIKKNKAPRSKSDEGVKDMYLENCKILMRESEDSAMRWKTISSWIGRINSVR